MDIIVRKASFSDFSGTIDVIKKSHRISFAHLYPKELIEDFCQKYTSEQMKERAKNTTFFVAEDTETKRILGVIALTSNQLRTFFVDPDFQGKGIGKLLYQRLEQEAKKQHFTKLFLEGSPVGEPIYTRFGFKKIKTLQKKRHGFSYTDAYMEKELL